MIQLIKRFYGLKLKQKKGRKTAEKIFLHIFKTTRKAYGTESLWFTISVTTQPTQSVYLTSMGDNISNGNLFFVWIMRYFSFMPVNMRGVRKAIWYCKVMKRKTFPPLITSRSRWWWFIIHDGTKPKLSVSSIESLKY